MTQMHPNSRQHAPLRAGATGFRPIRHRITLWRNPQDRDQVLDLHVGATPHPNQPCELDEDGACIHNHSGKVRYVVPAHGELEIPSEFDRAIQDVRDGVIVGGLGPYLVNVRSEARLHESLDVLKAEKKKAEQAAQEAIRLKNAAEAALSEKHEQLVEAHAKLQAAEAANKAEQSSPRGRGRGGQQVE